MLLDCNCWPQVAFVALDNILINLATYCNKHVFFQLFVCTHDISGFRLDNVWIVGIERLVNFAFFWLQKQKFSGIVFKFVQLPFAKVFRFFVRLSSWFFLRLLLQFWELFLLLSLHLNTYIFSDEEATIIVLDFFDSWSYHFLHMRFLFRLIRLLFCVFLTGHISEHILVVVDR